ncbi:MAG TPA: TolC family protein [Gemmatimonadales bacterium]|jgi:outer membrane protein TolC
MPTCRLAGALILLFVSAVPGAAQSGVTAPRQLSLSQALDLARRNNPTYQQAQIGADPAAEAVKAANWARLPTLSAGGGVSYTGAGSQTFGGTTFSQSSPTVSSGYSLSANWQLNTRNFTAPAIQKAQEQATLAGIDGARITLTSNVTTQYLNTLRAGAVVGVAVQQLARDTAFLELARARQIVGQATMIDVLQAQTDLASAKVQWLQAKQTAAQAKIELIHQIGLPTDANVDSITLSEPFPLVQPTFDLGKLEAMAHEANPTIQADIATQHANELSTRAARLDRLPTLSISSGINGYTQQFTNESILLNNALAQSQGSAAGCQFQNQILAGLTTPIAGTPDCNAAAGLNSSGTALLPSVSTQIRSSNNVFPFNFTRQPITVNFQLSLPIWDGYSRSLSISRAAAAEDQSREGLRAQQLTTDAAIQSQLLAVQTAWDRSTVLDSNRAVARERLQLAQDRYRIGNGTALDVADAQNTLTQADADYISAVYDYHLAVASLEAAVGRPLR